MRNSSLIFSHCPLLLQQLLLGGRWRYCGVMRGQHHSFPRAQVHRGWRRGCGHRRATGGRVPRLQPL